MTVALQTPRNRYIGTGTTGPFAYGFRITAATDLAVTRLPAAAVTEIPLAYPADYSVSGVGNVSGGAITLTVALAVGDVLLIRRAMPIAQGTNISNAGPFYAATHETALDKGVMIDQQQQEQLDRSLRLPPTTDTGTVNAQVPAPEAGKFIGWDATGTKLVNGTGAQGPQGPAGVGGPIPIFDTTAARDAFYPAPALNNMAWNRQTGFQERNNGAGRWLGVGVTREAGPVVAARAKGAWGDGAHDDRQALLDMDTAVAVEGVGELDPGIYRVDANMTLSGYFRPNRKALLRPNAGVKISVNGPALAEHYQFIDLSLGGTVDFTLNPYISETKAYWWGLKRDGTDDLPALQAAINATPDNVRCALPDNFGQIGVAGEVVLYNRVGVRFGTNVDPRHNQAGIPIIKRIDAALDILVADVTVTASDLETLTVAGTPWVADAYVGCYVEVIAGKGLGQSRWIMHNTTNAIWWTPNPGLPDNAYTFALDVPLDGTTHVRVVKPKAVFSMYRSRYCEVEGVYLKPNGIADICVNIDSPVSGPYAAGGIGTGCMVTRCVTEIVPSKQHGACVANCLSRSPNLEYHIFDRNLMAGGTFNGFNGAASNFRAMSEHFDLGFTAGSPTVTGSGFTASMIGHVIRGADAGVNTYRSFPHTAIVTAVADATHLTMNTNAVRTAVATRGLIGRQGGYGVFIGANPNAKAIKTRDNQLYSLGMSICCWGGGFQSAFDSFTDDDTIFAVLGAAEPNHVISANAEHCQHLLANAAPEPLFFTAGRFDNGTSPAPSSPFVDSQVLNQTTFQSTTFEGVVPADASIFSGWGPGCYRLRDVKFNSTGGGVTFQQLFAPNFPAIGQIALYAEWSGLTIGVATTVPRSYSGNPPGSELTAPLFAGDLRHTSGVLHLEGGIRRVPLSVTVTSGGPSAVDCTMNSAHRLRVQHGAGFTYPNPSNPTDGAEIDLEVWNDTAGALGAMPMGSAFLGTFTLPAAAKTSSARWRYSTARVTPKWIPVGAQSPDA